MNILDKVIQEWSYRTDKGYPDISSEEDMAIFESMFGFRLDKVVEQQDQIQENTFDRQEYYKQYFENLTPANADVEAQGDTITISLKGKQTINEEENTEMPVDTIIDLVKSNKGNKKLLDRVYRTLQASPYIVDLKTKLKSAGLSKDLFDSRNLFDEIISILQKGEESSIEALLQFQEKSHIPSSGRIYKAAPGIPSNKLKRLANLTGARGSVTMGKGEIIFPILYSDIKLKTDGAGDLQRGSNTVELKALGVSREGKKAGGGRFGVSRSFENYKPLSKKIKPGFLNAIIGDISQADLNIVDDVYKNINSYIDKIYPGNTQKINETNIDELKLILKKAAVESYIKLKKIDEFLLFNPISGDFNLITPATELLTRLESGEVNLTTATSPQLVGFN